MNSLSKQVSTLINMKYYIFFSELPEPIDAPRIASKIGAFSSAMPMDEPGPLSPNEESQPISEDGFNVLFLAASLFEFNIDKERREAGFPYLTYVQGEVC